MKIGSGWTNTTEKDRTYISVSLDKVFGEMYPFLKNCYITLWYIPKEERTKEDGPVWDVTITVKDDENKKAKDSKTNEKVPT